MERAATGLKADNTNERHICPARGLSEDVRGNRRRKQNSKNKWIWKIKIFMVGSTKKNRHNRGKRLKSLNSLPVITSSESDHSLLFPQPGPITLQTHSLSLSLPLCPPHDSDLRAAYCACARQDANKTDLIYNPWWKSTRTRICIETCGLELTSGMLGKQPRAHGRNNGTKSVWVDDWKAIRSGN